MKHNITSGFSLVQMAVVVSVLAIMATSGAVLGQKYLEKRRYEITEQRLEYVEKSILTYFSRYGYFPCPSGLTETLGDIFSDTGTYHTMRASGQVDCTHSGIFTSADGNFYMGGVPWKELKIPYEYAIDGWGRKNIYAMPKSFKEVMEVVSYSNVPQQYYQSDLVYWFDAAALDNYTLDESIAMDYATVADNEKIVRLTDSDGSNIHLGASATPTGEEPVFAIHESGTDKFPVLRFDGNNDELEIVNHTYTETISSMTLFITARLPSSSMGTNTFISYDDKKFYEFRVKNYSGNSYFIFASKDTGDDPDNIAQGPLITSYTDGNFHHFALRFKWNIGTQFKMNINNVEFAGASDHKDGANDIEMGSNNTRRGFLGVKGATSSTPAVSDASGYFTGDIAEVILYQRRFNNTELTAIYNYLNNKWSNNLLNVEGPFLTLNNVSDTQITDEAIFVLLSTGATGEGGYTKDGTALSDPVNSETEYNNIPIASFPSTLYAIAAKDSDDYRLRYNIGDFDDIVRYADFDEIKIYKDNNRVN